MVRCFLSLILIWVTPVAQAQVWEALASATQSFNASCPSSAPTVNPDSTTEATLSPASCPSCRPSDGPISSLVTSCASMADEAYLVALAGERALHHRCAVSQLDKALGPDAEFYQDDIARKLEGLAAAHVAVDSTTAQRSNNRTRALERQSENQQTFADQTAALAAIESSIPFASHPLMDKFINDTLGSMNERASQLRNRHNSNVQPEPLPPDFTSKLRRVLVEIRKNLEEESKRLTTGSAALDRSTRESLAQDHDLVESLLYRNPEIRSNSTAAACRVDRVYGRGAEARDQVLLYGSIGSAAVAGVAAGASRGAAYLAFQNGARVASARGLMSANAARIFGTIGAHSGRVALATGTADGLRETASACLNSHQIQAQTGPRCENYTVKAITADNCYLAAGLAALDATSSMPRLSTFIARLKGRGPNAENVSPLTLRPTPEMVLGRQSPLTSTEAAGLARAHAVGDGMPGADGSPARIGNYTREQLDEKARILRDAGFNENDRRRLIESGLAGNPVARTAPFGNYETGKALKSIAERMGQARHQGGRLVIASPGGPSWRMAGNEIYVSQSRYRHLRKHFVGKNEQTSLQAVHVGAPNTIAYLQELRGKPRHTILIGDDSETATAEALSSALSSRNWNVLRRERRGTVVMETTVTAPPSRRYEAVICQADKCDDNLRRGDVITFYPKCGAGVFQLNAEKTLQALDQDRSRAYNALEAVPCGS